MTADHVSIIDKIRGNPEERQNAIKVLVSDGKLKADIRTHVLKNKGTEDDSLMIFHDSIICFTKKVFSDRTLNITGTNSSYIYGIARNLWLTRLRKDAGQPILDQMVSYDQAENTEDHFSSLLFNKEKTGILHKVLSYLQTNCKEILLYWAGGYNMSEIANLLGYKSEGVARKKKFYCFKSLIDWLEEHPQYVKELKS